MQSQINFGYPWYLSYGHLVVMVVAGSFLLLGFARKWSKVWMALMGAVTVWSLACFAAIHLGLDVNGRLPLPTQRFLASGRGHVLDMGAGTGRSSLMVLEARPQTTLVALDLFTESYQHHFGSGQSGQERLLSNLRAAGLEHRATVQTGDMRDLPFEAATFDAVVSTYAIDHLNSDGVNRSLSEASRVLKPEGEFLMMVLTKDLWLTATFGPLLLHSGFRGPERWTALLQDAGLQVIEQGTRPGTLYFLAQKP